MLGMAALDVRAGNWTRAVERYVAVLNLNPRDTMAQAALISLQDNVDPVEGESHLKNLIRREPESAPLHFSLGNLYAAQSRWAEAQAAFFNAFRNDSDNADFVFNLAVSLDHLAQKKVALEYYQRALELADNRHAGFEPDAVLQRIRALSEPASAQ